MYSLIFTIFIQFCHIKNPERNLHLSDRLTPIFPPDTSIHMLFSAHMLFSVHILFSCSHAFFLFTCFFSYHFFVFGPLLRASLSILPERLGRDIPFFLSSDFPKISFSFSENTTRLSATSAIRFGKDHQSIKDIRNVPHCLHRHIRPDKNCQNIQPAVTFYHLPVPVKQIFNTALPVIVPAQDRGKCKEYQTHHQNHRCHQPAETAVPSGTPQW